MPPATLRLQGRAPPSLSWPRGQHTPFPPPERPQGWSWAGGHGGSSCPAAGASGRCACLPPGSCGGGGVGRVSGLDIGVLGRPSVPTGRLRGTGGSLAELPGSPAHSIQEEEEEWSLGRRLCRGSTARRLPTSWGRAARTLCPRLNSLLQLMGLSGRCLTPGCGGAGAGSEGQGPWHAGEGQSLVCRHPPCCHLSARPLSPPPALTQPCTPWLLLCPRSPAGPGPQETQLSQPGLAPAPLQQAQGPCPRPVPTPGHV